MYNTLYSEINNAFETAEFWCIVSSLTTILGLLQRKNFTFS